MMRFWLKAERRRFNAYSWPRGVAQLVEHRSPKPRVVGSSPSAPAIFVIHQLINYLLIAVSLRYVFQRSF